MAIDPVKIDEISNIRGPIFEKGIEPTVNRWNLIQSEEKEREILVTPKSTKDEESEKQVKYEELIGCSEDVKKNVVYNVPGDFSNPKTDNIKCSKWAPRENEITADLDESIIISGSRARRAKFQS